MNYKKLLLLSVLSASLVKASGKKPPRVIHQMRLVKTKKATDKLCVSPSTVPKKGSVSPFLQIAADDDQSRGGFETFRDYQADYAVNLAQKRAREQEPAVEVERRAAAVKKLKEQWADMVLLPAQVVGVQGESVHPVAAELMESNSILIAQSAPESLGPCLCLVQ